MTIADLRLLYSDLSKKNDDESKFMQAVSDRLSEIGDCAFYSVTRSEDTHASFISMDRVDWGF